MRHQYDLLSTRVANQARQSKEETMNQNMLPVAYKGQPHAGGGCGVMPISNSGPVFMKWHPELGDCPTNLSRFLCWMFKGLCSFNKFGAIGHVKLLTNALDLPDPDFAFDIGPDNAASLGVFMPRDWVSEAAMKGIFRVKVSFQVLVTEGALTAAEIERQLFDSLEFRILQIGSQDNFHTALNFGDAQDAERSTDTPSQGGYWLCKGDEFVPYIFAPEVFTYDFEGQAPGVVGTNVYTVTALVSSYFRKVC